MADRKERLQRHRDLTRELVAKYCNEIAVDPITADEVQIQSFIRKPAKTKKTMFNWHAICLVTAQLEGQTGPHPSMYEVVYNSDRRSIWISEWIQSRNDNLSFEK